MVEGIAYLDLVGDCAIAWEFDGEETACTDCAYSFVVDFYVSTDSCGWAFDTSGILSFESGAVYWYSYTFGSTSYWAPYVVNGDTLEWGDGPDITGSYGGVYNYTGYAYMLSP